MSFKNAREEKSAENIHYDVDIHHRDQSLNSPKGLMVLLTIDRKY